MHSHQPAALIDPRVVCVRCVPQIEQPFGFDYNDLPLDAFCLTVQADVLRLLDQTSRVARRHAKSQSQQYAKSPASGGAGVSGGLGRIAGATGQELGRGESAASSAGEASSSADERASGGSDHERASGGSDHLFEASIWGDEELSHTLDPDQLREAAAAADALAPHCRLSMPLGQSASRLTISSDQDWSSFIPQ